MEVGSLVIHKRYFFVGIVVEEHEGMGDYVVYITRGVHPFNTNTKLFIASEKNLTVLKEATAPVVAEEDDSYAVELENTDGSIVRFSKVTDFIQLMDSQKK